MDTILCPECGGDCNLLGVLGNLAHYKCRQCGIQVSDETITPIFETETPDAEAE